MWDAFTGELRCSYRPYNQMDEVVAAQSIAFDSYGERLYCGFNKMIRIFDVSVPGRNFQERPTCIKKSGQLGIISSFAFSSTYTKMSAAGSYGKTVGIYSEPSGFLEHILYGHQGGVTHLCFSPDGTKLFSGGRKDPEILCWDMRNLGSVLFSLRRAAVTNQRLYFDVSRCGNYLVSGNTNGIITIWDLTKAPKEVANNQNLILEPIQFYQGHGDCVNGISLHPTMPLLATTSGQRKYPEPLDSDEQNEKEMFSDKNIARENSMRLWWVGVPGNATAPEQLIDVH